MSPLSPPPTHSSPKLSALFLISVVGTDPFLGQEEFCGAVGVLVLAGDSHPGGKQLVPKGKSKLLPW